MRYFWNTRTSTIKKLFTTKNSSPQQNLYFYARDNKITENEKYISEGLRGEDECLRAMNQIQSGKSPLTDGLPIEFHKVF